VSILILQLLLLPLHIFATAFDGAPFIMMLQQRGSKQKKFWKTKAPNIHLMSVSEEDSGIYLQN
jgi:hypothetical protein